MGTAPIIRIGGNSQEHTQLFDTPFNDKYELINKTLNENPLSPVSLLFSLTLSGNSPMNHSARRSPPRSTCISICCTRC